MTEARDVIAKWSASTADRMQDIPYYDTADLILAALREAGFAPPLSTGAIHKALQDAFQAGAATAFDPAQFSLVKAKHEYCDEVLAALLKARWRGND